MADRTGKEASAADLWQGLKIRMDDRQAAYRRSWLRLGLAAVSIDDNGTDYRDTYVALGDMYVCAVRRGMEPVTYFEEAAEISSGVSNIEQTSMRDFLLRFEGSAYFGEAVAPKLK